MGDVGGGLLDAGESGTDAGEGRIDAGESRKWLLCGYVRGRKVGLGEWWVDDGWFG